MEVKDLMIDDLVLYTEFGKNEFHRIEIVEPTRVWLKGCKTYIPDVFIKPIPLTPEILEKNGFKKELAEDGIHYRFTLINNNTRFSLLYARSVFQWLGPLDFKYVHELQHALRLCGIEKEILLWIM